MTRHATSKAKPDTKKNFVSDTEQMLAKLHPALAGVTARRALADRHLSELMAMRNTHLKDEVEAALPDLTSRSIAKLNAKYPNFLNATLRSTIANAQVPKVSLITWIMHWGDTKEYKDGVRAHALAYVQVQFRRYLDQMESHGTVPRLNGLSEQIETQTKLQRDLAEKEAKLSAQIASLEHVQRTYSRDDAPLPPEKLREAVSSSAEQMRSMPNTPISSSGSSGGMNIFDYLVLDSILNQRHRTDDYHPTPIAQSRDDDYRSGGDDERGPISTSHRHDDDGNLGGSSRMSVDDANQDGAGNATTMSTPTKSGWKRNARRGIAASIANRRSSSSWSIRRSISSKRTRMAPKSKPISPPKSILACTTAANSSTS